MKAKKKASGAVCCACGRKLARQGVALVNKYGQLFCADCIAKDALLLRVLEVATDRVASAAKSEGKSGSLQFQESPVGPEAAPAPGPEATGPGKG